MVMTNKTSSNIPLRIEADDLGHHFSGSLYEEALHCYFIYNLVRGSKQMRNLFGEYRQILREVPVSVADKRDQIFC